MNETILTKLLARRTVLAAVLAAGATPSVWAQAFPDRPVKVVVPFAAGNTLDNALRQVAVVFKNNTGQQLLIDNKPGGGGLIAAQAVAQAPADGYTLLLSSMSQLAINPHTFSKLPYDADKSYRHLTGFLGASLVLAVHPSVPAANVKEFVAWSKAKTGGASYASFTAGNSSHFAGVILNQKSAANLVHVPFNGTPPAVQALVGGQVDAAFLPLMAVKPQLEAGKVKVLAVTSPKRSPLLPQVATFSEQGLPELDIHIWSGLSAPAGTPDAVIAKLNAEFVKVLRSDEIRSAWQAIDFEPMPMAPDEFRNYVLAESRRWAEAVRLSGFKASE
jgi:tripartite-type tricarboxylate transporter receptor subunit TctC